MANIAVEDNDRIRASNVEFHLPQPSYTIDTLTYLEEKYPDHRFVLLMGSDNLPTLHKWKMPVCCCSGIPFGSICGRDRAIRIPIRRLILLLQKRRCSISVPPSSDRPFMKAVTSGIWYLKRCMSTYDPCISINEHNCGLLRQDGGQLGEEHVDMTQEIHTTKPYPLKTVTYVDEHPEIHSDSTPGYVCREKSYAVEPLSTGCV